MPDIFQVGPSAAVLVGASPSDQRRITNAGPKKLFYKTAADVDTGDTEVAVNASVTVEGTVWLISEVGESKVFIDHLVGSTVQDLTIVDEFVAPAAGLGAVTWQPLTAESGTDVAFAEKQLFTASIFLPYSQTLTGIKYLLGAGGGTNKVIAALFDASGTKVANSSEATEGTVAGTEKTVQTLAFTSTYAAEGPARYFIGITANGTTAKLRTITANTVLNGTLTDKIEIATKNVVPASITVPASFVASEGPVAGVY